MRKKEHVDSERPYPKTQVNPEMVLTLELRNIGQILGTYWEILCKYWADIVKILDKCCANIGKILSKYWENIVQMLGKYCANTPLQI